MVWFELVCIFIQKQNTYLNEVSPGTLWTYTPAIFSPALKENLAGLQLPEGMVILEYIDNIMIWSSTKQACEKDPKKVLHYLAENGHKKEAVQNTAKSLTKKENVLQTQ